MSPKAEFTVKSNALKIRDGNKLGFIPTIGAHKEIQEFLPNIENTLPRAQGSFLKIAFTADGHVRGLLAGTYNSDTGSVKVTHFTGIDRKRGQQGGPPPAAPALIESLFWEMKDKGITTVTWGINTGDKLKWISQLAAKTDGGRGTPLSLKL